MQLKELEVSVRLTDNFNSYGVTKTFTVEKGEEVDVQQLFRDLQDEIDSYIMETKLG